MKSTVIANFKSVANDLVITFNSGISYIYPGLAYLANPMKSANSLGKFFHMYIKGHQATRLPSSFIADVSRNRHNLTVTFLDGSITVYHGAAHLFTSFLNSDSFGKTYNASVKGKFPSTKIA